MKAILLSGGIDSAALAFLEKPDIAININYGQKSAGAERNASKSIAKALSIQYETIDIDCSSLGSGDLTTKSSISIAPVSEWWPYRNQLLLTLAAMQALNWGVTNLSIGAVSTDKAHKDGTSMFFHLINELIVFQEGNLRVCAPAINLTTLELISEAKVPSSILGWTHSCHVGNYPCGICNGCKKHFYIKTKLGLL
jgi:7-cyano-7-deazaguanine synthase